MNLWEDDVQLRDMVTNGKRAFWMSNPAQRLLRSKALADAAAKKRNDLVMAANKHASAIENNRRAEAEVLLAAKLITISSDTTKEAERRQAAYTQRESMDDTVVAAHLASIMDLAPFEAVSTVDKCKAFSKARHGNKVPLQTKRSLATQQAFEARTKPVLPEFARGAVPDVPPAGDGVPVPVGEPVIITAPVHHAPVELNAPAGPRPSALLRQADFQRDMATAFPLARAAIERLADEVHLQKACDTADALAAHHGRLVEFVRTSQRFVSPDHRRARCWQFMSASFYVLVAIATAHGHVGFNKESINVAQPWECLLVPPGAEAAFTPVADAAEFVRALQGGYLHWCILRQRWVRSGSTSGGPDRGFAARDVEHAKGAELLDDKAMGSDFYVAYRTEAATARRPRLPQAKGRWGMLRQYVVVGFVRVESETTVGLLESRATVLRGRTAEAQAAKDKAAEAVVAAREVLQPRAAPAEVAAAAAPVVDATAPGQSTRPSRHIKRRRQFDEAQDQSAPAKAARGGGGAGAPAPGAGAGAGAGASTALPPSTSKRLKEAENELDLATKSYDGQAAELQRCEDELAAARSSRSQAESMCRLFDWQQCDFETYLANRDWKGRDQLQKKAGVVAYLIEAKNDILLAKDSNLSRSPGFEGRSRGAPSRRWAKAVGRRPDDRRRHD
jgi:hypothetical protein